MAGAFTYPGVYIQELPSPVHTISGVPTAITAFVGAAARGPVNDPVSISSLADYERAFGNDGSFPLFRAVSLFYQNGGGDAIVVRVAGGDKHAYASSPSGTPATPGTPGTPATPATPGSPATPGTPGTPATPATPPKSPKVWALSPGVWGNNLKITIDQENVPSLQSTSLYNLSVEDTATSAKERYVGITANADPTSPSSLLRMLARSSLITAARPLDAAAPAVPAGTNGTGGLPPNGTFQLAGGVDQPPIPSDLLRDEANQNGLFAVAKHNTFFNLLVLTPVYKVKDDPSSTPTKPLPKVLVVPPEFDDDVNSAVLNNAAEFALHHRAMLIADAPQAWTTVAAAVADRDTFFNNFSPNKTNVAVYFPRLVVNDPTLGTIQDVGPSAAVAGLHALTDASRGVWKAAAGIAVQLGGANLSLRMSDDENGKLNPIAVNCLRSLPVVGNVIWGARTTDGDDISASQWKYVPIRRLALYIEESLYRGTQWVVFEPNDEPLWAQVRLNVGAFMHTLFRQGAFQGTTAKDAYFVKCDSNTNPQVDIDNGILNAIVGFAPLKPAEFVVIKIQQIVGQIAV